MPNPSPIRPRRLRSHAALRDMLASTRLVPGDFVAPLFIRPGTSQRVPIKSMPGVFQLSTDAAVEELKRLQSLGVRAYILFGITDSDKKNPAGSHAHNPDNEVCRTIKTAKDAGVSMLAMTDLCFCEYTSHGHCMVGNPPFDNDAIRGKRLGEQAVGMPRRGLMWRLSGDGQHGGGVCVPPDGAGFSDTAILSYAVKYASSFLWTVPGCGGVATAVW